MKKYKYFRLPYFLKEKVITMSKESPLKPMLFWRHAFAYVTLGLLCGWYFLMLLLIPLLVIGMLYFRSTFAGCIFALLFGLTIAPLNHNPWVGFMNCWIWDIWREYFGMTYDNSSISDGKFKENQKYMFFEFPHGIFPMGQFLSASLIKELTPGHMICGTGADIVFMFPVMRQIMAWLGTMPASRKSISKIYSRGHHCAIIPGGIAEMYVMNPETEAIYFKKRRSTVKVAIQEGAHIIPTFFFGNTKIFRTIDGQDSNSWISKVSRRFRASIVLFYGRNFLPVPFRHHLHMVSADIVEVKQSSSPTEEDIDDVMHRIEESLLKMYSTKKPEWEKRPLSIM